LSHFKASLEKYFYLLIVLKQNKLAETKTVKKNAKQALSRSQQNSYYTPKPEK